MRDLLEHLLVAALNRRRRTPSLHRPGVVLGHTDSGAELVVPDAKRTQHLAILGRTGSGKSSLLRFLALQDVQNGVGFVLIDLHAETFEFILRAVADEEIRRQGDLSPRMVIIEPGDPLVAVGLNVLEATSDRERFLQVSEITAILKHRWHLESFGARTEELLRNSLLALSEAGLTLVDLPLFLTSNPVRTRTLDATRNAEVRSYFAQRYGQASEAMQSAWREPVLNKVTAFTSDPQLRHMLGQPRSTVALPALLDAGSWILLNLDKSRLGEQAATLGSLFLTKLKNAIFVRRQRQIVTVYADELQNLVAYDADLETLLSESRKFGCAFCTANQYLDQYPPSLRAAVLAIGTHVFFQLSAPDADKIASFLGSGKHLQTLLANLPPRHFVIKSGHHDWQRGVVPTVTTVRTDPRDLHARCRGRWARSRTDVEVEIQQRHAVADQTEVLDEWE